jgi:hypothetical protein
MTTSDWHVQHAPAGPSWRTLGPEPLLALLGRTLPYNVRYALAADALVALAMVHAIDPGLVARRAPWLATVLAAAAGAAFAPLPPAVAPTAAPGVDDLLTTVLGIAVAKGWKALDGDGPGRQLAVPGEHSLPPLALVPTAGGLRIERPLPLLAVRDAEPSVQAAVAHGTLVLNGLLRGARVVVHDPRSLTFAVEAYLPVDGHHEDETEDEAEAALEAVRHGAPYAAGVLDCLRNPAVARIYAAAHNLPAPSRARGEEV